MKKLIYFSLIILITFGCKESFNNQKRIVIKGQISKAGKINADRVKSATALSLVDATKVLIYFGFHDIAFVDIVNGAFSANAGMGKAAALVFLNANNQYIGTLQIRGLNLLPLGNLSNGEQTVIDLSTLTQIGTVIIPSHDPFGNEITISDDQINSLKELDGFFESLAKNIDTDNDGVLDVLGNKQLFVISHFSITAGHWGLKDTKPVFPDSSEINLGFNIDIFGDSGFDWTINNMTLTGPDQNPYPQIKTEFINSQHMGSGFFSRFVVTNGETVINQPFREGIYTLDIEGKLYTFGYSYIDAYKSLIIVVPTLHTNSDGKLTSFTLEYKLPNGKVINPENILKSVLLQFSGDSGKVIFESPWMSNYMSGGNFVSGIYSYSLASPVDISGLKGIVIAYDDMIGNRYDSWWR